MLNGRRKDFIFWTTSHPLSIFCMRTALRNRDKRSHTLLFPEFFVSLSMIIYMYVYVSGSLIRPQAPPRWWLCFLISLPKHLAVDICRLKKRLQVNKWYPLLPTFTMYSYKYLCHLGGGDRMNSNKTLKIQLYFLNYKQKLVEALGPGRRNYCDLAGPISGF